MKEVTVVIPVFNEEANIHDTYSRLRAALDNKYNYELVFVNDGSTDATLEHLRAIEKKADGDVIITSYRHNAGRGKALRTGFAASTGKYIVSIDADLSYSPDQIINVVDALRENDNIDVVLGSAYMPGGRAIGVPFKRLLISKLGNHILKYTFTPPIYTSTCVFRAYKRHALEALDLISDGKEIHLEILSKVLACGFKVKEIPAVLTARKKGKSKSKYFGTALTHLMFSFEQKAFIILAVIGLLCILFGTAAILYVLFLGLSGSTFAGRPLLTYIVISILVGIQITLFGYLANGVSSLKKELYRLEKLIKSTR